MQDWYHTLWASTFKYTSLCLKSNLNGVRKCEPGSLVQRKSDSNRSTLMTEKGQETVSRWGGSHPLENHGTSILLSFSQPISRQRMGSPSPRKQATTLDDTCWGSRCHQESEEGKRVLVMLEAAHTFKTAFSEELLLTFPPPAECLMLSLEPHLDWTLLKSIFLLKILT